MSEYKTFEDFNLKMPLLRGIYGYGFETPSKIQEQSIPLILEGNDLIAQASAGRGKTASFGLSSLQIVDDMDKNTQVLIISPTRELTQQSHYILQQFSKYMDIKIGLCIGGTSLRDCIKDNKNAQIILATTGRLIDLLYKGKINLNNLKLLVVDEADEMLTKGFIDNLQELIQNFIPESCQIALFSATYPDNLDFYTSKFLRNPKKIRVEPDKLTLDALQQFYVDVVLEEHKFSTLCDLYKSIEIHQAIIYTHSKRNVIKLYDKLINQNFTVSVIHGDMTQLERTSVMDKFRKGETRILLSTDLLARGIDIQQVSLVINYDLPRNKENYMHRVGRSARFGKKGTAISLICEYEYRLMKEIQDYYSITLEDLPESFIIN